MGFAQIFAIVVFLVAMALIISEKVNRAVVAVVGAVLLQLFHVVDFHEVVSHTTEKSGELGESLIDWNTLGVLLGMMLFVAVVKETGLFEFLAIHTAKMAKGNPWRVMMLFMVLTAILSAFLDNVTTVLLIGPMTFTICELLDEEVIPFFIFEILASNIGGTATLIGDPPNIMIGSQAHIGFADFLKYNGPVVVILMIVLIGIAYLMYGRKMTVNAEKQKLVMELEPLVEHRSKMILSVVMLVVVVFAFMFHATLGVESSVVALSAAGFMLLLSGADVVKALHNVEWTTLVFFGGLFIIVGGMKVTGTIEAIGNGLVQVTGGNVFATMILLVVASAVISAFLDNIPFVATMIPIITAMEASGQMDGDIAPLWWALSLGACLGGNGSLIGASANVVLADISTKHGHPISFMKFTKIGFPIMLVTVVISAIYLVLLYQFQLF
ncbi:MAG: ArsB/NhaD family transporter [Actinomycetaceae bacterium]|nr:ArsB/NhaD family transporter [Actinomycetaceae bacterium]